LNTGNVANPAAGVYRRKAYSGLPQEKTIPARAFNPAGMISK
jgi:hypothetical protein